VKRLGTYFTSAAYNELFHEMNSKQLTTSEIALLIFIAFLLGDGPLDLEQQRVMRVVADRPLHEDDRTASPAEFFASQAREIVFAGVALGADDGEDVKGGFAGRIAELIPGVLPSSLRRGRPAPFALRVPVW
jgi:hypothetical protein